MAKTKYFAKKGPKMANFLCIFVRNLNGWPRQNNAPKILKFFLGASCIYTQPWKNFQIENQYF